MTAFTLESLVNEDGSIRGVRDDGPGLQGRWYFPVFEAKNIQRAREMYLDFLISNPEIEEKLPSVNEAKLVAIID